MTKGLAVQTPLYPCTSLSLWALNRELLLMEFGIVLHGCKPLFTVWMVECEACIKYFGTL